MLDDGAVGLRFVLFWLLYEGGVVERMGCFVCVLLLLWILMNLLLFCVCIYYITP